MTIPLTIRASTPEDRHALEALYPAAFPDEDLLPLVNTLMMDTQSALSLIGSCGETLAGHVVLTFCGIDGTDHKVALLGPLAVAPAIQKQGIGRALVEAGFGRMRDRGVAQVFVLGDPQYYGRLGFKPDHKVTPPYTLPDAWREAWQSHCLDSTTAGLSGVLSVPAPWREAGLWLP